MTASQPAPIYLMPHDQIVGAGLLAKAAWQATKLDCVHIHCCGNGHLGFRPDGGSLSKSAKVSKALLPHHSAPRLGSVCPNAGLNPWAAATRHPWRGAANPASCRVTHEFKPAFGQRGLTGRLRSKAEQDQERLASHRGYHRSLHADPCRPQIGPLEEPEESASRSLSSTALGCPNLLYCSRNFCSSRDPSLSRLNAALWASLVARISSSSFR